MPTQPRRVTLAAKSSRLEMLVALRDRLARAIDNTRTHPRDLGTLTLRLIDVTREIEEIETKGGSKLHVVSSTPDEGFDAATA